MTAQKVAAPVGVPWPSPQGRTWRLDGVPIPTAKAITQLAVPSGGLGRWGARMSAAYAVSNWEQLGQIDAEQRRAAIAAAPFEERPASRGPTIQDLLAALWGGETRAAVTRRVPAELRPVWRAVCAWLDATDVTPVMWERVAWHPSRRYVAAVDLIAQLRGQRSRWLLAIETGETVHPEVRLRLAAAKYAPCLSSADGRSQTPWPRITATGVLHIQPQGVTLVPVAVGQPERVAFDAACRLAAWLRVNKPGADR